MIFQESKMIYFWIARKNMYTFQSKKTTVVENTKENSEQVLQDIDKNNI